jgi:hypothetical protein
MSVPENPLDFSFKNKSVLMPNGATWQLRELSVAENDDCADLSRRPDTTVDARVMMRFILVKSTVEPVVTMEQLTKIPNNAYLRLADAANELNSSDEDVPAGED